MKMSTISGFVIGVLTAIGLTIVYGDKLQYSLSEVSASYAGHSPGIEDIAVADPTPSAALTTAGLAQDATNTPSANVSETGEEITPTPAGLEQRWAAFASQAETLAAVGDFPWRACFARAAASYQLPETLLLAIASGESNFDPVARSDQDAVGLMQILWPGTSHHLGVLREADLYDPCTNVDAGARYLKELAGQYNNNLHLMVAAYNYGPGRVSPGDVPEGARWYSGYIYQHLQQVLGSGQSTGDPVPVRPASAAGRELLMTFNGVRRAEDFMSFLTSAIPNINLQLQSESLGQHDVVLLYHSESERNSALNSISAAGVVPATTKLYL